MFRPRFNEGAKMDQQNDQPATPEDSQTQSLTEQFHQPPETAELLKQADDQLSKPRSGDGSISDGFGLPFISAQENGLDLERPDDKTPIMKPMGVVNRRAPYPWEEEGISEREWKTRRRLEEASPGSGHYQPVNPYNPETVGFVRFEQEKNSKMYEVPAVVKSVREFNEVRDKLASLAPRGVDHRALAQAHSRFVDAQSRFLVTSAPVGTDEYLNELSAYSVAQGSLIQALTTALRQADIV